jgi:hypothetical protein
MAPPWMVSLASIVLVNLRHIIHPETWGAAADPVFNLICDSIMDTLLKELPGELNARQIVNNFKQSVMTVQWKAAGSIAWSLEKLAQLVDVLIQALFWEESIMKPSGYLQSWRDAGGFAAAGSGCWVKPHSIWNRMFAQFTKKLVRFITSDVQDPQLFLTPPLQYAQKRAAWADVSSAATLLGEVSTLFSIVSAANEVDVCKIFSRVKSGATLPGGLPVPPLAGLLEVDAVNAQLEAFTAEHDPLTDVFSTQDEVSGLICDYTYSASLGKVKGLSQSALRGINHTIEYVEDGGLSLIRASLQLDACPMQLEVEGSFELSVKVPPSGDTTLCKAGTSYTGTFALHFGFSIQGHIVADAHIDKLFTDNANAFSVSLQDLKLGCSSIEMDYLDIPEVWGETVLKGTLNTAIYAWYHDHICSELESMLKAEVPGQLSTVVALMGEMVPEVSTERRRLTECPALGDSGDNWVYASAASRGFWSGKIVLTAAASRVLAALLL